MRFPYVSTSTTTLTKFIIMTDKIICSITGTEITRDMIIGCISDTFKSINGIRPRWMDFSDMSYEELGDYLTELQDEEERAYNDETAWEVEQAMKREAKVLELVAIGASDTVTARKWLDEADKYYY